MGQSEENIRNLFADAEAEYAEKGEESDLHLIIFDEIDAICKQRGASRDGTGVGDSVVNQLLSKIDGVDAVNNVIVIGMTNRKDMLDEVRWRVSAARLGLRGITNKQTEALNEISSRPWTLCNLLWLLPPPPPPSAHCPKSPLPVPCQSL